MRTDAERFADFMAESIKHGPPIATGTVRRYLDQYAVEVAADVVRFRDGSQIERADGSFATSTIKKAGGMRR